MRHEYFGGTIHAMSGSTAAHNRIAPSIASHLLAKLRGGPCRIFIEDVDVRLEASREHIFHYPDVVVSWHPTRGNQQFVQFPTLVVKVLSPSTETIDRPEKKMNYLQAQTLEEYVLVAREGREVTIFRRATVWVGEIFTAPESLVEFRSANQAMTLADIYEDVAF